MSAAARDRRARRNHPLRRERRPWTPPRRPGPSPATPVQTGRFCLSACRPCLSSALPAFPVANLTSGRPCELLRLLDRFLDGAHHVERLFGQMVVVAGDDALEALDRVLKRDENARRAGEDFRDVEG